MKWTTLGIDVAKQGFQLHGVDDRGEGVIQKRVRRTQLLQTVAQLPACVIGMEACRSAQFWAIKSAAYWPSAGLSLLRALQDCGRNCPRSWKAGMTL